MKIASFDSSQIFTAKAAFFYPRSASDEYRISGGG
jgi:hypothetical protein